jgi:hypothetical protein
MANPTYLDSAGATRYRKAQGSAGTNVDPDVLSVITDSGSVVTLTGSNTVATVTAVTTLGTITNVVHVDDNSGSLTVDNGGTFAVQAAQSGTWNITNVSGTVSLPTGASTAAKQPALGTAGTASTDVITVQGITSMTPILTTLSGTNNIATVSTVTSLTQMNGAAIAMNTGVRAAGVQRVTICTDDIVPASQSGTWTVGLSAAQTLATVTTVGTVSAISAGSNVIGDVGLSGRTSGGLTLHRRNSTGASGEATNVKNAAGQLFWALVTNTHATSSSTTRHRHPQQDQEHPYWSASSRPIPPATSCERSKGWRSRRESATRW